MRCRVFGMQTTNTQKKTGANKTAVVVYSRKDENSLTFRTERTCFRTRTLKSVILVILVSVLLTGFMNILHIHVHYVAVNRLLHLFDTYSVLALGAWWYRKDAAQKYAHTAFLQNTELCIFIFC